MPRPSKFCPLDDWLFCICRPFIIDLESTNGTFVNDSPIPTSRYFEIMLGDAGKPGSRVFTHTITKTRFIKMILSVDGESDGLEIEDESGSVTVLRFENPL